MVLVVEYVRAGGSRVLLRANFVGKALDIHLNDGLFLRSAVIDVVGGGDI